jgi:putative membrane-bound dehydrogenase-like protein
MNNSLSFDRERTGAWLLAMSLWLCSGPGMAGAPASNGPVAGGAEQSEGTNALPGFQIERGFRLELVAAEPLVSAPVAMAFDEDGRLFVAEMPGVQGSSADGQSGRIRMLQDTNGDGVFETSTVYADNLPQPSAVACYAGGLFVATTPDLLYLRQSGTNGHADERTVVFSGTGITNAAAGPARLNNLNWGLDNRIHGVTGPATGVSFAARTSGSTPAGSVGSEIILDPRAHIVASEAGPACSGLSFDNWGCRFVSEPSRPLRTALYKPRYTARNPFFAAPREILDVASPDTRIFNSALPEPREAGATAQAWLTNACGGVIYRGSAFPLSYSGNAFVADPQAHVIHRMVLREDGLEPIASRPAEERSTEFLVSRDASFHPVQIVNGPDGTLYIADRQGGSGSGRIYRIVPLGFKRPKVFPLGKANTYDLVAMLSHPNGWQRDTAARLLYAKQDPAATTLLAKVLGASATPLARLHALYALDGSGGLSQDLLLQALRDRDGRVREHAVLLSEKRVTGGNIADPIWNQLLSMTADPSLRVRYQLAFTLGEVRRPRRVQALVDILLRDPDNLWVQTAVLSSVPNGAADLFVTLANNGQFRNGPTGQAFLRRLATMIGVQNRPGDVARVVSFVDQTALGQAQATAMLSCLGDGVHLGGGSLVGPDPSGQMHRLFVHAFAIAANPSESDAVRIDALRLMSVGPDIFGNARSWLLGVFGANQPPVIQSAALSVLGRFADPQITSALTQNWPVFSPSMRRDALAALLARYERGREVMAALQDGRISQADVPPAQVNLVRTFPEEAVRQSAVRLFGPVPLQRTEVVQRFMPALNLRGTANAGRGIFTARCTACHRLAGQGQALGPDLAAARVAGKGRLLTAILDPNAGIQAQGGAYVVETAAGELLIGLLVNDYPAAITLGQPRRAPVVVSRANLLSVQAQPWSLMPVGLEEGLSAQDMADLLEYVMTAR